MRNRNNWSALSIRSWSSGRGLWAAALFAAAGCSGGPSAVTPPSIDAEGAASAAIKQYDADGDGFIADSELDKAVSLKAAMATLDGNKDGKVSQSEIADRIRVWQANKIGLTGVTCRVTIDGKQAPNLKVEFVPEEFLGSGLIAADGETSMIGSAIISIPKEKRPDPTWPPGVQYGFYRVKFSGGGVPAKYAEGVVGQQVAPDDPAILSQNMQFKLSSK